MKKRLVIALALLFIGTGCGTDSDTPATGSQADAAGIADGAAGADGAGHSDAGRADDGAGGDDAGTANAKVYPVGVIELETIGAHGRKLPTQIWYPAITGGKGEVAKYMLGLVKSPRSALVGVEAAEGKFPLIAFSHGNGGVKSQSVFLTEYLAAHGYVVVSPDHVGNTTLDIDNNLGAVMSLWRPLDIKAAIDRVMTPTAKDPAWLKGLVHKDKVGMTGHSFGGYTTLAMTGIQIDMPMGATVDCATPVGKPVCETTKVIGEAPWNFGDKRIAVAVPLAHALYGAKVLSHASAKKLKVPVVMMASNNDTLTPATKEAEPLFADLPGETALLTIQGGNHYSFANMCELSGVAPAQIKTMIAQLCAADAKPTMAQTHATIAEHALAAFDIYLKGDDTKRAMFTNNKDGGGIYTLKSKNITK
ncbi:MAG: dienelactone hydrolase family protein [Myxococcales bacterium]|nr:dienelactone hydrolase family protein [Myxococcales bacterium]